MSTLWPSASRSSLDSLIVHDGRVTTESQITSKTLQLGRNRRFSSLTRAWSDVRSSNLHSSFWIIVILLAIGFRTSLSLLFLKNDWESFKNPCDVSGTFNRPGTSSTLTALAGFFQINIGFGNLTFTQAKVIDTLWDFGIGRGGQMCLAVISGRLFADYSTISLTARPLSFATFHTIFSESEPSIASTWRMMKSFIFQKRLSSRISSAFIIFSMCLILAFPTLASAATGYAPITRAIIREQGNEQDPSFISFSNLRPIAYIIHDFWRVNTLDTSQVVFSNAKDSFYGPCLYNPDIDASCYLPWAVSNYTKDYGFYGLSNISSSFMGVQLEPPTLNIEACYIDVSSSSSPALYGWNWTDPNRNDMKPFRNSSKAAWEYSNKTYWLEDIMSGGSCTPETGVRPCRPLLLSSFRLLPNN
ncbi:hypothetical protein NPX13_g4552 [Xylaria arbuscula]|uniref:Uncharacterized protein n=1 Tax=Xylaria arbuscula TaxID=114810 RepID=A0A9W8NG93_9PEZI|nr:hypothetical protein NPX13_g4552 [Xylaria arbuscula]